MKIRYQSYLSIVFLFLFFVLYVLSSFYYSGGSQNDKFQVGFNWFHNYWCDLLNEYNYVGQLNPSRPIAIIGMFFLCTGLALIFYIFPKKYLMNNFWSFCIRYLGMLTMFTAFFVFTPFHDLITIVSSLLGILPLIGIYKGLFLKRNKNLLYMGLGCIVFIMLNNLIYYSEYGIYYLPLLQKISFLFIILWFILISLSFSKQ